MGIIRDWKRQRQWKREMQEVHEMARLVDTGEVDLHTVGTTPNGIEIQFPTPLLGHWYGMSAEAQDAFMAALDRTDEQGSDDPR